MVRYIKIFVLFALLSGCISNPTDSGKKKITVSILPQKYFVEAIAGDHFEVTVMIPPGGTPETYEPTARQMQKLSESTIYMKIGHIPFEDIWLKNINKINPRIKITDLSEGIDLIGTQHSHEGKITHKGTDPHIWSSPRNAAIIGMNIFNALSSEDPDNKTFYFERLQKFLALTDSLDRKFSTELALLKERSFLIFHPALSYLARDYDLEQISIEFEGKSPPPGYIRDIINIARDKKIKTIFVQKQFNAESANTIAEEIQGKIVIIDPLDEKWNTQIQYIVSQIKAEQVE